MKSSSIGHGAVIDPMWVSIVRSCRSRIFLADETRLNSSMHPTYTRPLGTLLRIRPRSNMREPVWFRAWLPSYLRHQATQAPEDEAHLTWRSQWRIWHGFSFQNSSINYIRPDYPHRRRRGRPAAVSTLLLHAMKCWVKRALLNAQSFI